MSQKLTADEVFRRLDQAVFRYGDLAAVAGDTQDAWYAYQGFKFWLRGHILDLEDRLATKNQEIFDLEQENANLAAENAHFVAKLAEMQDAEAKYAKQSSR